jgi:hypothetical protein
MRSPSRAPSWAAAVAVAAVVVAALTSCGPVEENVPPGASSAAATPSTLDPATTSEIAVTVTDGTVSPQPGRFEVGQGTTVRITVTSDVADTAHVHGYDELLDLPAGEPATLELVADEAGLFEVETHGGGKLLFQLVVR